MKIVGICGSMRVTGSNSEWMVRTVLDTAKELGAETELILLREYNIKHCEGCDVCRKIQKGCKLKDDMQKIYPKLKEADAFVIGTPNYFKNVSGLMKDFIDRTNASLYPKLKINCKERRPLEDKRVVGISVGGEELEDIAYCEGALTRFFRSHRLKTVSLIKCMADEPKAAEKDPWVIKELKLAAKKLVSE